MDLAPGAPVRGATRWGPVDTIPSSFDQSLILEGTRHAFPDTDPTTGRNAPRTPGSGNTCHCILLRNSSGGTLSAGDLVVWEPEFIGKRTNGATAAADDLCCGVVDDHLTYDVRANDLFWCFYKGPVKVNITAVDIADLAIVSASATAGKAALQGAPGSDQAALTGALAAIGQCIETTTDAATAAIPKALVFLDIRFVG